jgi:tRNA-specific 2-thiouridylase
VGQGAVPIQALERGLIGAHKGESQDLCFVQDGGYARFVEQRAADRIRPGKILDAEGRQLATHPGIHRFTLGQRKGLGVAAGRPVFVARIDAAAGNVIVDDEAAILVRRVVVAEPVLAAGVHLPAQALVQVRYRHAAVPAVLQQTHGGALEIVFDRPVRAPSPGQFAVAYEGDQVVAGGIISDVTSIAPDPASVSN